MRISAAILLAGLCLLAPADASLAHGLHHKASAPPLHSVALALLDSPLAAAPKLPSAPPASPQPAASSRPARLVPLPTSVRLCLDYIGKAIGRGFQLLLHGSDGGAVSLAVAAAILFASLLLLALRKAVYGLAALSRRRHRRHSRRRHAFPATTPRPSPSARQAPKPAPVAVAALDVPGAEASLPAAANTCWKLVETPPAAAPSHLAPASAADGLADSSFRRLEIAWDSIAPAAESAPHPVPAPRTPARNGAYAAAISAAKAELLEIAALLAKEAELPQNQINSQAPRFFA